MGLFELLVVGLLGLAAGLELLHQVGHLGGFGLGRGKVCHQPRHLVGLLLAGRQFIQCLFMGLFELLVVGLRGLARGLQGFPVQPVLLIQLGFLRCKRSGLAGGFPVQLGLEVFDLG